VALFIRSDIEMTVAPIRNPTFVVLSDGSIRNTYDVRLLNKQGEDRPFKVTVVADQPLEVTLEAVDGDTVMVPADTTFLQRVYVVAAPGSVAATSERVDIRLWVEDVTNATRVYKDTIFNGKEN
jgi:polyferredoxin